MARDDIAALELRAAEIPAMGGREMGEFLRAAAREDAIPGTAIVELGCWFGAGAAQLTLGLHDRTNSDGVAIHCFDRWKANEAEAAKAALQGVDVKPG